MDNFQINNFLKKKLGHVFKGVYARDQLAALKTQSPACYVVNTHPITSPGEHWIAIYVTNNRNGVYFDSFGLAPKHPHDTKPLHSCLR